MVIRSLYLLPKCCRKASEHLTKSWHVPQAATDRWRGQLHGQQVALQRSAAASEQETDSLEVLKTQLDKALNKASSQLCCEQEVSWTRDF